MKTEVVVGLLFLIGIAVLIVFALSITSIGRRPGDFALVFPAVGGLKEGDAVTYNGVRIGAVSAVEPVVVGGAPRVRVVFDVDPRHRPSVLVSPATRVAIEKEMLGQSSVALTSTGGAMITPEALAGLLGRPPVSLGDTLTSVQQLVEDNRQEIKRALTAVGTGMERFGAMSEEVRLLVAENRPAVSTALVNVGEAAAQVRDTLARNRDDLSGAIVAIKDAATQAYAALRENRDSLREAIADLPLLVGSMTQAAEQIRDAVKENRGDLKTTMGNVAGFSGRLEAMGANLQRIVDQIASGRGTIGRLVMEDTAHDKATAALDSLQARLEEVKPVTRGFSDLRFFGGVEGGMNTDTGASTGRAYLRIEPKPWKFYQFGIGYRGAPADRVVRTEDPDELGIDFDLLLGWRFLPEDEGQRYRLSVAAGLIDSKPGAWLSTPLWSDRLTLEALVRQGDTDRNADERRFEESSALARAWVGWRVWERVQLRAGVDDLGNHPAPFVGLSAEILDNDLRNLTLGSSFLR